MIPLNLRKSFASSIREIENARKKKKIREEKKREGKRGGERGRVEKRKEKKNKKNQEQKERREFADPEERRQNTEKKKD